MASQTKIYIYIDGINRTKHLVLPLKVSDLLDERLDECTVSLRNVQKKFFPPLTPVEIVFKNKIYFGKEGKGSLEDPVSAEEATKHFFIADDVADESIVGRGFYNHDLALIEVTKLAELVTVDTITFTNDIGRNYLAGQKPAKANETKEDVY